MSAPGAVATASSRDTAKLAERIAVYSLLDPATTDQVRAGIARSTCPHCGERASLFATALDYRCDACDAGGDVVALQMALHRVPFRTAVAQLAVRAELAPTVDAWMERVGDAQLAMDTARKWYREQFLASPTVQEYWTSRGFSLDVAAREGIGYAPVDSSSFFEAMREARIKNSALFDSGLVRMGREAGSMRAFFRDRLLFPITDVEDVHCVAFGGRYLTPPTGPNADRIPKYLNSPNSVLYQKSSTLVGLGAARSAMRKANAVIVVEGYFTRLRVMEAGAQAVVATCGTSLTAGHAQLLALTMRGESRERCTAAIFYDDGAIDRALQAAQVVGTAGIDAEIIEVPPGTDDADTYGRSHGLAALRACAAAATTPWELLWRMAGGASTATEVPPLRARIAAFLRSTDLLLTSRSRYARKEGTDFLSARYNIPRDELAETLKKMGAPPKGPTRAPATRT
jgi:DNA primase